MGMFRASLLASLLVACTLSTSARADLIIVANGITEATDTTNVFATVSTSIGNFNITDVSVAGVNAFGGDGEILDAETLAISSTGSGILTLLITETNLTAADVADLSILLSGLISNATVETSLYLDTTNSGLLTTLLASTTGTTGSFLATVDLTGLFSITEEIVLTASGAGATLSADDGVITVQEPASLAVLGVGLIGIGMVGHQRRSGRTLRGRGGNLSVIGGDTSDTTVRWV